ncbi:MAG: RnfABCDGE type electron transport complex subunit D [Parasporobacterium sp.]|nr:RnfABCDGE type electron transport complex subunit D [Parasporobacterium sp.]
MSQLTVSSSPHIRQNTTTQRVMLDVIIALMPALIASVIIFGFRALLIVAICVACCVLAEFIWQKLMHQKVTVSDLTAVVTGILLAYNLPVGIPIWQAIIGCIVAIIGVKQLFGGVGKNFVNPAITARIVMFLAFSVSMTTWVFPDAVSSATPLGLISSGSIDQLPSLMNMFLGVRGGCLGETSVLALLLGGIYLVIRKVITWHTPVIYIATVFLFTLALGQQPVYQIMSGGLMLGAIFMATDYVTTPYSAIGKIIFGLGAGILTVIIRVYGSYPEGVSYSILLMNILTPYINRIRVTRPVGGAKA